MHFGLYSGLLYVTALIRVVFRGAAFIRGRRVFQCQYPKVRRLLEGDTYLRPSAY